jgi:hypothetical protein
MTNATREALEKISQTLHEAGWDAPTASRNQVVTPARLARIRHAYETLLRNDHFGILEAMLVKGLNVDEAGARMGLSAEDASSLFAEALQRLTDFVETCDEQEASPPRDTVRKPTEAK